MTREPRARWSAPKARDLRACSAWRERIGTSSSAKIPITKIVPMPIARAYPGPGATLSSVDGLLDWYLLGVVLGLGVVAGVGLAGALSSGPWVALALAAAARAVTVALLALPRRTPTTSSAYSSSSPDPRRRRSGKGWTR